MSPERARYGVVVEGDLGGLRHMLLHPLPQEYFTRDGQLHAAHPWATVLLAEDRYTLSSITLSSTNVWVEVES